MDKNMTFVEYLILIFFSNSHILGDHILANIMQPDIKSETRHL